MPAAGYKSNNHYQPPATLHQNSSQRSLEKYSGSTAGASAISFPISLVTVTETDRPLAGPRLPQLMPSADNCTHDGKKYDVITRVDHEQAQRSLFE